MFGRVEIPAPRSALAGLLLLASATVVAADASQSLAASLADQVNVTTFTQLLKTYPDIYNNLPTSGSKYTILAPNDAAFRKLQNWGKNAPDTVREYLSYHILQNAIATGSLTPGASLIASSMLQNTAYANVTGGQKVIVTRQPDTVVVTSGIGTRSTITNPDIAFEGGLVQVIDSVMDMPVRLESTARENFKDLTAFAGALHRAGIAQSVAEMANVTIFAPSNAAFQLLGSAVTDMSKEELARVLNYHIVPGRVEFAATMGNGTVLSSAIEQKSSKRQDASSSTKLTISRFNNDIFVNSAKLLQTDIIVANGVVQMIDNVLSPDAASVKPEFEASTQKPVLRPSGTATAVGTAAPIPFITDLPCTTNCPARNAGQGSATTSTSTSTSKGAGARCTGLPVLKMGAVAVGGVLGMEMVGLI